MSQNPTNATYWKKRALNAEALATEAGKALGVYAECWCNRESRVDDEGNEHLVEEPCGVCAILAKLAAAGLLPASQEEREG